MSNMQSRIGNGLAFLAVATLLWVGPPAIAQSTQDNPPRRDSDTTRAELASFDRFLDEHQQISQELRGDPARIRSSEFLQRYPELQAYLASHPMVREELNENPSAFMRAEERLQYQQQFGPGSTKREPDVTRRELASFDRFLDDHQQISQELRGDPSRIRNSEFLQKYPELQAYLQSHPGVREELNENPNSFMWAENTYDYREQAGEQNDARPPDDNTRRDNDARQPDSDMRRVEENGRYDNDRRDIDRDRDRDYDARANRPDRDTTRGELASFDRFLDSHREVAEQLRKNPSLVKNNEFLQTHPQLQTYLQEHPAVREELNENPRAFMTAENRYDRAEDRYRNGAETAGRDREMTHGDVVSFDQFLDHHRVIAEQLRKDPSLVNNQKWMQQHPELQSYLQDHKNVREQITANPGAFMTAENRYEQREDSTGRRPDNTGRDYGRGGTGDMHRNDVASFREFLGSHSVIAQQLTRDPSLAKNQQFLSAHPEFREYLSAHPGVQTALTQDPHSFIKSTQTTTSPTTKTTTTDPTSPPQKP